MKLSKRLEMVASLVPAGSRVADIGTDHGYLPICLAERGLCPGGFAMDVREGPLERARAHIREHGLSGMIETRLSDGLARLKPGEADAVVIAGMGGQLMIHILEGGRHMWESTADFILSPQSDPDQVRRWLEENGFRIQQEDMVLDEGKYYTAMLVKRGNMNYGREIWYRYGKDLIEKKHPALASFLKKEEKRVLGILANLKTQHSPGAREAEKELEGELALIREAQGEIEAPGEVEAPV